MLVSIQGSLNAGLPEQVECEHIDTVPVGQPSVNNFAQRGLVASESESYRVL